MFKLFTDRFSWSPNPVRVVGAGAGAGAAAGVDSGVISTSTNSSAAPAHVRAQIHSTQSTSTDTQTGQGQPRPAKRRKVAATNMSGAGANRKAGAVSPRETKVHANRATMKRSKRDGNLLATTNSNANVKVENASKIVDQIEVTDRDLTAARETVNQRQISRIQSAIEKQMCLEILYKHNELERIDCEIAKCTVALEQLVKCQTQGFTATSGRIEDMRMLVDGRASFSMDTPTTLDSPFAKPYRNWLDDPTAGFRSLSTSTPCENCATGQIRLLDNPHMTRNRNTSTASTSMQALPLGYPKPRRDKSHLGPVIMKRADGETVKLQCPQCKREDFANVQGFVNHCRITKHSPSELKTHEDAAAVCGIVVDEAESAAAKTQPSSVLVMNRVEWKVPSTGKTSAQVSGSTSPKAVASEPQGQLQVQKPGETSQAQSTGEEVVIDGQVSSKAVEAALSQDSTLSQKCKAFGLLDDFLAFGEEHRQSKEAAENAMSDVEDEEETNENEQNQDEDDTKTICDSPIEHATPRKRKPTSRRSIPLKLNQTHGTAALLSVDEADNDPMDLDYQVSPTTSHHSEHSFAHDAPSLTTDDDDEHDVHSARSLTAEPEKSMTRTRDADHYTDESEHSRTASDKENIYTVKIDLGSKKGSKLKSNSNSNANAEIKKKRGRPKKVEIEDELMDEEELEEVHLVDTKVIHEPDSPKRKGKPLSPTTTTTSKSKANSRRR